MKTIVDGVTFDVDPGTFRATCEGKGVTFAPMGGRLSLQGPEASVKAARTILDANVELEKAIAETLYAERVAWYEKRIRQIEAQTLAEGLRLFKGAVPDVTGEELLPRGGIA